MKNEIKGVCLSFVCQENWNSFRGNDQARFCDKCKKSVLDFTGASRQDLEKKMAESTQSICGRFSYKQMNPTFARSTTAAIAIASVLSACQPETIEPTLYPSIEGSEIIIEEEIFLMGEVMQVPSDTVLMSMDREFNESTDPQTL